MDAGEKEYTLLLTGPAKVNGKWRKAGESVTVSETVRNQLRDAKVIHCDLDDVAQEVKETGDIRSAIALELGRRAVATAVKERDAHWSTAFDHFETIAQDRQAEAIAVLAGEHRAELETLDAELDAAKARIGALETDLATATARAAEAEKALAAAKPPKPAK